MSATGIGGAGAAARPADPPADAAPSRPALAAHGLVKHFPVRTGLLGRATAHVRAVDGVSFEVPPGRTFAIVGESGCGKSTVARLLLRLIEPDAGRIALDGEDLLAAGGAALRRLRGRIQLVFQDPYGSLNPRMTAGDMLAEPLMLHGGPSGAAGRGERVAGLLSQVGLRADAARRYPHEFSGGQRQRLAIARALAAGPRVIVCDEPVSALDVSIQAQILNLLADLQRMLGLAYVFISHDLSVVRQVATEVGVMYLGRLVETGPAATVFASPRHPYTRALLSAVPVPDPAARGREPSIGGDVPSPLAPPPGCSFHARCPHAEARCRTEVPPLAPTGEGDGVATACWRWREIAPPAAARAARTQPDAALARLQAAFAR